MPIQVCETKFKDCKLIKPTEHYEDYRGENVVMYNKQEFLEAGIRVKFIQNSMSVSMCGVLRGLHGDDCTWKLITCLEGGIYLVVVDPTMYGEDSWQGFTLSDRNRYSVLIPPKYANGHFVLTDKAIFHYNVSCSYDMSNQFTIPWDDPRYEIDWPIQWPLLSVRDKNAKNPF